MATAAHELYAISEIRMLILDACAIRDRAALAASSVELLESTSRLSWESISLYEVDELERVLDQAGARRDLYINAIRHITVRRFDIEWKKIRSGPERTTLDEMDAAVDKLLNIVPKCETIRLIAARRLSIQRLDVDVQKRTYRCYVTTPGQGLGHLMQNLPVIPGWKLRFEVEYHMGSHNYRSRGEDDASVIAELTKSISTYTDLPSPAKGRIWKLVYENQDQLAFSRLVGLIPSLFPHLTECVIGPERCTWSVPPPGPIVGVLLANLPTTLRKIKVLASPVYPTSVKCHHIRNFVRQAYLSNLEILQLDCERPFHPPDMVATNDISTISTPRVKLLSVIIRMIHNPKNYNPAPLTNTLRWAQLWFSGLPTESTKLSISVGYWDEKDDQQADSFRIHSPDFIESLEVCVLRSGW